MNSRTQPNQQFLHAVEAETHEFLVALIQFPVEFGGSLRLQPGTRQLVLDELLTTNMYDEVPIPNGFVQFHTHPEPCSSLVDKCSLPIPSAADIIGYANAFARGQTLVHLVYTTVGVFVLMVEAEQAASIRRDAVALTELIECTRKKLRTRLEEIKKNLPPVQRMVQEWMQLVRTCGISIELLSPLVLPKFYVRNQISTMAGS